MSASCVDLLLRFLLDASQVHHEVARWVFDEWFLNMRLALVCWLLGTLVLALDFKHSEGLAVGVSKKGELRAE